LSLFAYEDLLTFAEAALETIGVRQPDAATMATYLAKADLHGYPAHGVAHIPFDLNRIKAGAVDLSANPEVVRDGKTTAIVDGHGYLGQITADMAMRLAIEKAKAYGSSTIAVRRSANVGRLADYHEIAADAGMISMSFVSLSGGGVVVPFGGLQPFTGTNPMAYGIPVRNGNHILLDFATASMSNGQIRERVAKGEELPPGVLIDQEGTPRTKPQQGENGTMTLPFGGYKGGGLQVITEILGGVLTGDGHGAKRVGGNVPINAYVFQLFAVKEFQSLESFYDGMDEMIAYLKSRKRAPGVDEILVPGERSRRHAEHALQSGVGIEDAMWDTVIKLAEDLGLTDKLPAPVAHGAALH
jgi:LDH2 family malate/lactate/ureidoglycolate dehydrogenase